MRTEKIRAICWRLGGETSCSADKSVIRFLSSVSRRGRPFHIGRLKLKHFFTYADIRAGTLDSRGFGGRAAQFPEK